MGTVDPSKTTLPMLECPSSAIARRRIAMASGEYRAGTSLCPKCSSSCFQIIGVWVQGSSNRTEFEFLGLIHDLEKQILLRGKVVVQRRFGAAGPRTDLRDGSAFEPHLPEDLGGALENGLTFRFSIGLHERRVLKLITTV